MLKKNIGSDAGSLVRIKLLDEKEDPKEFRRFINTLIKEDTYLLVKKQVTLKEETQWLANQYQIQRKGEQIFLKVLAEDRLIGTGFAQPGFGRNQGNVNVGLALLKPWRGKGIGRMLLEELIVRSMQKWHPKNIYLHVISSNTITQKLYKAVGFRPIATLPEWFEYHTHYLDEYLLILDQNYFLKQQKKSNRLSLYSGIKKI
jgi:ribosomal protein S18 acetylase RimI-like enzyme